MALGRLSNRLLKLLRGMLWLESNFLIPHLKKRDLAEADTTAIIIIGQGIGGVMVEEEDNKNHKEEV
jgi:hypothetical protein